MEVAQADPVLTEEQKKEKIRQAETLLYTVTNFLKSSVDGIFGIHGKVKRALTIIRKPYNDAENPLEPEDDANINTPIADEPPNLVVGEDEANPNPLSIRIGEYTFTLNSKCIMHDRRYVSFTVSGGDLQQNLELTAYASSSQVGSWRLCKTEKGNRLNKFDDYVQSTIIQWKLTRFICYWFYRHQLLWDDEPDIEVGSVLDPSRPNIKVTGVQAAQMNQVITERNQIRNNLFCHPQYPCHQNVQGIITPPPGYSPHTINLINPLTVNC
jgi:hypothetical protein